MGNPPIDDIRKIIAADARSATPRREEDAARSLFVAEQKDYICQQTEVLKEELKDIQHFLDLLKKYADRVFVFMFVWCAFVFAVLLANALCPEKVFRIDTSVLCTLIGGTTISVIGLVGFMMQGLFHTNGANHKKS